MGAHNTHDSFGWVTRTFHWTTALLIIIAIPLGAIANRWGIETQAELATTVWLFSMHKTVGVAVFFVALARIAWALTQRRPGLLNATKRAESFLAEAVHWALYLSLVLVPLSGWVGHAASEGFAPIWWPFGQSLPLVPKSVMMHEFMGDLHWFWSKVLIASLILHVAGALKHHFVDRDETLRRMTHGVHAGTHPAGSHVLPAILASLIFVGLAIVTTATSSTHVANTTMTELSAEGTGNWTVQNGEVKITVSQFGAPITGEFANWTADIAFDDTTGQGQVSTQIDIGSLTLGSVTDQAMGPDYFDTAAHTTAIFAADIMPNNGGGYIAVGTLTLKGITQPAELFFDLEINGDTAQMNGSMKLQRLAFDIGANQPDEGTLGLAVVATVTLNATRVP